MKKSHPLKLTVLKALVSVTLLAPAAMAQNSLSTSASPANGVSANKQIAFVAPSQDLLRLRDCAQSNYQALQFSTAAVMYKRICETPTADANDFYWLGETYYHLHQYANAAQMFDRAISLNPAADNIRVRLVQSMLAAKQPEQARKSCTIALRTVTNDYAKRQLDVLFKVSATGDPPAPNSIPAYKRTGHLER